jgi:hypothetical protein
MKNQNHDTLSFVTKVEAIDYLNSRHELELLNDGKTYAPCGTYYLRHNEYSSPEFLPRKYGEEWGIAVKTFFYGDNSKPHRLSENEFGQLKF